MGVAEENPENKDNIGTYVQLRRKTLLAAWQFSALVQDPMR